MLVTDFQKSATEAAVNALTPEYTIGFVLKVAPINPTPTWQTQPTHWYINASAVPADVLAA